MAKNTRKGDFGDSFSARAPRLDERDIRIISLLVFGRDNKEISKELNIPLSTVQRRVRKVFESELVRSRIEPNYSQLGLSKGMLHVYVARVDAVSVAEKLAKIPGVISVSLHIGNSDIVAEIIYKNSSDLLAAISDAKQLEGVERVVWSEQVFDVPVPKDNGSLPYFAPG